MRRMLGWCAAAALLALALGLTAAHVTPGPGSGAFALAAPGGAQAVAYAPSLPEGPVAVNTADAEELDTLPGVTSVSVSGSRLAVDYDPTGVRRADIQQKVQSLGFGIQGTE